MNQARLGILDRSYKLKGNGQNGGEVTTTLMPLKDRNEFKEVWAGLNRDAESKKNIKKAKVLYIFMPYNIILYTF